MSNKDGLLELLRHISEGGLSISSCSKETRAWVENGIIRKLLGHRDISDVCCDIAEFGSPHTFRLYINAGGKFPPAATNSNNQTCSDIICIRVAYRGDDPNLIDTFARLAELDGKCIGPSSIHLHFKEAVDSERMNEIRERVTKHLKPRPADVRQ